MMTATVEPVAAQIEGRVLDQHGVAKLLGVHVDTVKNNLHTLPPGFKFGRKTLWNLDSILEHIRRSGR